MVPMDMRFPDTLTDEDIERGIVAAREIARLTHEVNEDGDHKIDPDDPDFEQHVVFWQRRDRELEGAAIEFTDLSWFDWGDARQRDHWTPDEQAAECPDGAQEMKLTGWAGWALDNHVIPASTQEIYAITMIEVIPHLMKARFEFRNDGRKFIAPIAPEMLDVLLAIKRADPEHPDFQRRTHESYLDYTLSLLHVCSLPPAYFDEWEQRYRSQSWPKVHLE